MTTGSFMRLGSANTYDNTVRNLTTRQASLSALQEQLSSGKKINRASDDPAGAAQAERATTRIERVATEQRALAAQRNTVASAIQFPMIDSSRQRSASMSTHFESLS